MKKGISLFLALIMALAMFTGCGDSPSSEEQPSPQSSPESDTKIITDMAGRQVTLPANPARIAPFVGPGYEKVIMLGATDRIAITRTITGWANVVAPGYADIPATDSFSDPNVEELLQQDVDVVFFWDYPDPLENMENAGIPVVVTQLSTSGNPTNIDEFIDFEKKEVQTFAEALGGDTQQRADEWCAYFDEKVEYVRSRTSELSGEEIPTVYYVRGPDALTSHGRNSYTAWFVELAGGDLVTKNSETEMMATPTVEDVVGWDPQYIFMGRVDNIELVTQDPAWSTVRAVKDGNVFVNPKGVMEWDYSSEGPLLMLFIAKTLHPDLFADLDMGQEIKDYFSKFYGYDLSDSELDLIMRHKDPA